MSSDSSTSPSPPPGSSSSSTPPPAADAPPPPSSAGSPPPPSPESSPPPPSPQSSPPPPPSPSNSGDKSSSPPPPSGKEKDKSPPSNSDSKSPSWSKSDGSPSPPSRSGNNDHSRSNSPALEDASGNDSSNQTAIVAGAAAGAALLLFVFVASMICCCCKKKKRKRPNHELQYYRDDNNPQQNMNNNSYYNNNPPSSEYMVKIPAPPPPASAGVSSEYGWTPMPPPPPPAMNSSEMSMSSGGFSGPHQGALPPPHPSSMSLGFNQSSFSYEDLAAATRGFAQEYLLGQGGFGYVHKGVLPNGKEIAVKSLKMNSGQGDREFHAEVDIISRVHHRHLVSLVGYCTTGAQRLLVYEFVSNGTLEYHLHGSDRPVMDWPTRHRIALGSAKGFAYLHEDCHPRIIHRDIKAANILIDSNFEAKVADFGLAKLSNDNYTHVSTRIMGTFGYLAPEYASSGKLTEKSDVYSFGVMLLELITGKRPIDLTSDDDTLVDWARPILMRVEEGCSYEELVDPRLGDNYDRKEMLHMVACAGACIRHSARGRPKMNQIVRALEGDVSLDDLNAGPKTTSTLSTSSSDYDLRKGALTSQEFSSEEHTVDFQPRR